MLVGPVCAGTLFVSGDVNVIPGGGPSEPNDNDVFLMNALGGGSTVKILTTPGVFLFAGVLRNFYTGQGVAASTFLGAVTEAQLAGADMFVSILPVAAFADEEIAVIRAFLNGGGTVFFFGDNASALNPDGNGFLNGALAGLGSSMRIVLDNIDAGISLAQVEADPFTVGVTDFQRGAASQVSGGTVLFRGLASSLSRPVLAYETIGDVPEPATWPLLGMASLALATRKRWIG